MLLRVFTLLLLGALAIGTWKLSTQSRAPRATPPSARDSLPGYYLTGTVMTDYDAAGAPSVKIAAERIEQVDQSTDVELHNVRLDYQTPGGQLWVMVGDKAHVQRNGKVVEVNGNVQMQGLDQGHQGPAVVNTDHITYDVDTAEVNTDSDVRIAFGPHTLTARGLEVRLKDRTMRLESRVYGRFTP